MRAPEGLCRVETWFKVWSFLGFWCVIVLGLSGLRLLDVRAKTV